MRNPRNCEAFPLGAGGGGAVLLFSDNPSSLESLKTVLEGKYVEIPFKIKAKGHELLNPIVKPLTGILLVKKCCYIKLGRY